MAARGRGRPGLRRPTARSPGSSPSGPSSCSTPAPALPLLGEDRPPLRRVAVVGPCADDPRTLHGLLRLPQPRPAPASRPRAGHRGPDRRSTRCATSCRAWTSSPSRAARSRGEDRSGFAAARRRRPRRPTCASPSSATSPACSATAPPARAATPRTSGCPGVQADLLDELLGTGTPVVVVVVSGRPYALGDVHGRAAGLVQAFMPGEEGGAAIAGVLSPGGSQPGGKLPVQIPRHAGGQPGTYLQPPLGGPESAGISSLDADAAVPVRLRRLVHHLRGRRPAAQRAPRSPPTGSSPCPCGCATPASGPATRSSSSTCTTSWPGRRGR